MRRKSTKFMQLWIPGHFVSNCLASTTNFNASTLFISLDQNHNASMSRPKPKRDQNVREELLRVRT